MIAQISVALCTCNGEKFLLEQLESLCAQTRPPDELVVCDDASQDETWAILTEFAARAPFHVRLFRNETRLGSTQNFGRAVGLCAGEIIVLCDQDDRWMPEKLERLERAFEDPSVGIAFSNALIMDESGRETGEKLWDAFSLDVAAHRAPQNGAFVEFLMKRNCVTGMTMAYRQRWRDLVLPIPTESLLLHDAWIALLVAAVADVFIIEEPLAFYRQHPAQQIGTRVVSPLAARPNAQFHAHKAQLQEIYRRLSQHPDLKTLAAPAIAAIPRHIAHIERRARFPRSRLLRIFPVAAELFNGRYHRFSNGLKSAARDLFYPSA